MDFQHHHLPHLFEQLGLAAAPEAIERFIASHRPLPQAMPLDQAPFWTPAQAAFLREEILEDGDWAEVVDELNLRLHS